MAEKPVKPEKKATPPKDDPRRRQEQWEELGQEDAAELFAAADGAGGGPVEQVHLGTQEGEITVDYGARGVRTFRKGDAVAEAINVPHNGKNTGPGPLRVFALYMGAEGLPTGIPVKK